MFDQDVNAISGYLAALRQNGFGGDTAQDAASRLVGATDNSIYHIAPDAILFPASAKDVTLAAALAADFGISLTARGGGTGTNGQSLNRGVIIDMSRHMTGISDLDLIADTVSVEPGVVLDQLNSFLRPHGVFFAPTVSTSSRATLGGMFATDASGKGSAVYRRMSDHVLAADLVLADGRTAQITCDSAADPLQDISAWLAPELAAHSDEITRRFPQMNRGMTGYNLDQMRGPGGQLNYIKLLAGSEGTLALTTRLTLRLTPIPRYRALTVLAFDSCADALAHVTRLTPARASAVEFLDDKILELAAASPMWSELEGVLGKVSGAGGFLFVEFTGDTPEQIGDRQQTLSQLLADGTIAASAHVTTAKAAEMSALWEMRKRSVGLLAAVETNRIGLPFVEDAAVPPEHLAEFVQAFGDLLSQLGLKYGMFGHADVGCVHVRPMLDMKLPGDRAMIRSISDQVSALCRKYNGLIWGEHGKGMRGEYVETYMGPDLFHLMQRIKAGFDPGNRLNPGKLVTALNSDLAVTRLDEAPMRGARDEQIDLRANASIERAVACNGNGACHNWAPDDPICPSYKVTRDKRQAPKGRASLLREWARLRSIESDPAQMAAHEDALAESLSTCLSCKSCTGQCPVRVDIPSMKSVFLESYYKTRKRPPRDLVMRHMEQATLVLRHMPKLANVMMGNALSRGMLRRFF
ncbi:MAG: FAD-binding oxidoreductase [Pelagimonas sp.]|jgi:FAD/FMN-containing dehydrogenase/ferredoxin|nr:FAD-binding oxidoreductase [Pelagimonas sp.]